MSLGIGLVGTLAVGLGLAIAVILVMARSRSANAAIDRYPALADLRRSSWRWRVAGLVLATVVGWVLIQSGGLLPALSPAVGAAIVIGSVMMGQQRHYRAAQTPGSAGLERRSLSAYLPRWLTATILIALFIVGLGLALGIDIGHSDRAAVSWECVVQTAQGEHHLSGEKTLFPSLPLAAPLAAGLVVVLVLAAAAVRIVIARPRNGADEALVAVDDVLRAQAVEGVFATVLLATSLTMLGVGAFGAAGTWEMGRSPGTFTAQDETLYIIPDCDLGGVVDVANVVFPAMFYLGAALVLVAGAVLVWSTVNTSAIRSAETR